MSDKIFIKPAFGRVCPYPYSRRGIPETGLEVTADGYWRRRLAHGDVVIAARPVKKKVSKQQRSSDDG